MITGCTIICIKSIHSSRNYYNLRKKIDINRIAHVTLGFLIWYGHPAGMMTASPMRCSKVQGSISGGSETWVISVILH